MFFQVKNILDLKEIGVDFAGADVSLNTLGMCLFVRPLNIASVRAILCYILQLGTGTKKLSRYHKLFVNEATTNIILTAVVLRNSYDEMLMA